MWRSFPSACSRRVGRCAAGGWSPVGRLAARHCVGSLRRRLRRRLRRPLQPRLSRATSAPTPATAGRSSCTGGFPTTTSTTSTRRASVPVFALPVLIWNAHYVLVFKLLMTACGVGFVVCAASIVRRLELSPLRLVPMILAPRADGPGVPQPLRPVRRAAHRRSRSSRCCAARERTSGGAARCAARRSSSTRRSSSRSPLRRVRSLTGAGAAYVITARGARPPVLRDRAGRGRLQPEDAARRHLQIESLGSSILLVGSKLGIHHEGWIDGKPGSIDLGRPSCRHGRDRELAARRRARARGRLGRSGAGPTTTPAT